MAKSNMKISKGTKISYIVSFIFLFFYLIFFLEIKYIGSISDSFFSNMGLWLLLFICIISFIVSIVFAIINYCKNKKLWKKLIVMYSLFLFIIILLYIINNKYSIYCYKLMEDKAKEVFDKYGTSDLILSYDNLQYLGVDLSLFDKNSYISDGYICLEYKNKTIYGYKNDLVISNYISCNPLDDSNEKEVTAYIKRYLEAKYNLKIDDDLVAFIKPYGPSFSNTPPGYVYYVYLKSNNNYIAYIKLENGQFVIDDNFKDYADSFVTQTNDSNFVYSAKDFDDFMNSLNNEKIYSNVEISYGNFKFIKKWIINSLGYNYQLWYDGKVVKQFELNNGDLYFNNNMNFFSLDSGGKKAIVYICEVGPVSSESKYFLVAVDLKGNVLLSSELVRKFNVKDNLLEYSTYLFSDPISCYGLDNYKEDAIFETNFKYDFKDGDLVLIKKNDITIKDLKKERECY